MGTIGIGVRARLKMLQDGASVTIDDGQGYTLSGDFSDRVADSSWIYSRRDYL